jgi:hypothetical protein
LSSTTQPFTSTRVERNWLMSLLMALYRAVIARSFMRSRL